MQPASFIFRTWISFSRFTEQCSAMLQEVPSMSKKKRKKLLYPNREAALWAEAGVILRNLFSGTRKACCENYFYWRLFRSLFTTKRPGRRVATVGQRSPALRIKSHTSKNPRDRKGNSFNTLRPQLTISKETHSNSNLIQSFTDWNVGYNLFFS